MVDSIFKNFERLLRWFYPGILLLILLPLSQLNTIDEIQTYSKDSFWLFMIVVFGIGAAIYLGQNVLNQIISIITELTKWDVAMNLDGDPDIILYGERRPPVKWLRWLAPFFDKQAGEIERKIARDKQSDNKSSLMDYLWGTYHATSITAWLLFVMMRFSVDGSWLFKFDGWWYSIPSILFVFSLYIYARLCRVRR
jgi:hypothetical protein